MLHGVGLSESTRLRRSGVRIKPFPRFGECESIVETDSKIFLYFLMHWFFKEALEYKPRFALQILNTFTFSSVWEPARWKQPVL